MGTQRGDPDYEVRAGCGHEGWCDIRVLSLFSGLGAFDLGLELAGMEIVGQVEIDPTCLRVLEHHWPDVRRWTDVRSVSGDSFGRRDAEAGTYGERADGADGQRDDRDAEPRVDLICGGFPCQDVSVAGQRAGLDGARSGLWFEFQRILSELRPRWCMVENVPGLLSSAGGRDFGTILTGLRECGFAGIGWRVLDSQFHGVPQRRRRVFIIGGPSRGAVAQVLSLCDCSQRHPQKSREAGEAVAATIRASTTSFGGQRYDLDNETYVPELGYSLTARAAMDRPKSQAATLIAIRTAQTSANGKGFNEEGLAYTLDGTEGQAVAHTLSADGFDASEDGTGRGTPLIAGTMKANSGGGGWSNSADHAAAGYMQPVGAAVRRLTPTECLRLQGLPDDWLDLGLADGPKYRMVGNAVTVPVVEYLGRRILELGRPVLDAAEGPGPSGPVAGSA